MAQTIPQLKPYVVPNGITYKFDSADGDDVHIVAEMQTRTDMAYLVVATVLVVQTDTSGVVSAVNGYRMIGTFMNAGGTLTQVSTTTADHGAETDTGWSATFAVSGTKIQVQVTLDASHTSSAPVSCRVVPTVVEHGFYAPHRFGSADNNPA